MALTRQEEKRVADVMRKLRITREEAVEMLAYDKQVDKTSKGLEFDLTDEQNKVSQYYCKAGFQNRQAKPAEDKTKRHGPKTYEFQKRERKENVTKSGIINELANFLNNSSEIAIEGLEIVNKERLISFRVADKQFELTLVQKRTSK